MTSRRRFSRRWLIICGLLGTLCAGLFLVVVLVGALVSAGKGEHLLWLVEMQLNPPLEPNGMPARPMPTNENSSATKHVVVGSVELSLPPSFTSNIEIYGQVRAVQFKGDNRDLGVTLPTDNEQTSQAFENFVAGSVTPRFRQSPTRMQAEIYKADENQFRWSMSSEELRYLRWRLRMKLVSGNAVETLFRDDIEGLLLVLDRSAFFEWTTTDGKVFGSLIFQQESPPLDLSWVRPICASLKFTGEVYPEEVPKETLEEIVSRIDR